jgi:signal transduction histidine kinase
LLSEYVDETALARLCANQEVILPSKRLCPRYRERYGAENLLWIPILLENRLSGALVIAKAGADSVYTPEEIELVKAVATQTVLVVECLRCLYEQAETRARALVQPEMQRLTNDFLNLASHELNTPLTVVKGNIQVAQRRIATLKRRDLIALLREAVARQQRSAPESTIMLEVMTTEKVVPIIADAERITQVINAYLANALSSSPLDQPVTAQLTVEDARARVSVHDEGPAIPLEEQGRVWQRFSYGRRISGQRELDLSLGLGFYLCRAFIERQHGNVGVQSGPGRGATFWFTMPLAAEET